MSTSSGRPRVLLVDTLSASNDFGVEFPIALGEWAEVTVFTVRNTRLRAPDCARIVAAFPEYGGPRSHLRKLVDQCVATARLARELWRFRHDTVHVQFFRAIWFELPLYMLARLFLRRLVCTVHNALPHERRPWDRMAYGAWYRLLDVAHVLSGHTGERLTREFGVPPQRVVLAPHGNYERMLRDYPPAETAATRRGIGIEPSHCLVLHFGLIRDYKAVERLVEAAAACRDPGLRFLIAGDASAATADDLTARVRRHGIGSKVDLRFARLDNQAMSDLIAAADVIALPYRDIYQSGALMLALSYGKAVVASDIPGFREYLEPGRTGVLCRTEDPAVLARELDALAAEPERIAALGQAARAAATQRFNWSNIARTVVEAYRD